MQRVITINLNGNAYQLDEGGYDALRAYLEDAAAKLKENPDKGEILADLEQAIGEKCLKVLSPHKTVVSAAEISQIIAEMGPVDAANDADAEKKGGPQSRGAASNESASPKRLYQIREGAMISGVCNGLAAYFGMDVTIMRIIFVVLTLLTSGVWLLAYALMMFVIPYANTSEESAAAHGQPFNARQLIEQAKRQYGQFNNAQWQRHWFRHRREWRRKWRTESRFWMHNVQHNAGYATQVMAGVMVPVLGICSAAFSLLWLVALISLVTTDAIFGWPLPNEMPMWMGILLLLVIYNMVAWPLRAVRRASIYTAAGHNYSAFEVWGRVLWLGFLALFFWLAYRYIPEVNYIFNSAPEIWRSLVG